MIFLPISPSSQDPVTPAQSSLNDKSNAMMQSPDTLVSDFRGRICLLQDLFSSSKEQVPFKQLSFSFASRKARTWVLSCLLRSHFLSLEALWKTSLYSHSDHTPPYFNGLSFCVNHLCCVSDSTLSHPTTLEKHTEGCFTYTDFSRSERAMGQLAHIRAFQSCLRGRTLTSNKNEVHVKLYSWNNAFTGTSLTCDPLRWIWCILL